MAAIDTTIIYDHLEGPERIIVEQGGARSGKSYNIMVWLIFYALKTPGKTITIARATMPALKATAFRDFEDILTRLGIYDSNALNKTEMHYQLNGCLFEFLSIDNQQKVRSRKRDIMFVNEANELKYDDWVNLSIRTSGRIVLDYNPSMLHHWIYSEVIPRPDTAFYQTTYLDNPFLDDGIVHEIERLKEVDETNWKIFGLGEKSAHEGVIFTNWQTCKSMPKEYRGRAYGLDFGFSNDPSALIELRTTRDAIYLHELIYDRALLNKDISDRMKRLKVDNDCRIIADSAEPKSIKELQGYGWRIFPSVKGPDSVRQGINLLKQYSIFVTESSLNIIKELQNYKWKPVAGGQLGPDAQYSNEPVDLWNHAIDATRYGAQAVIGRKEIHIAV